MGFLPKRALHILLLLCLVGASLLATTKPVFAESVITVTTTNDEAGSNPGKCSLREAIISANENIAFGGCPAGGAGTDIIILPASSLYYTLTIAGPLEDRARTGDLDITSSMAILGAGAGKSVVQVAQPKTDRVFHVLNAGGPVTFRDIGISGGYPSQNGGGIFIYKSVVTFASVKIFGNITSQGGGGIAISTASRVSILQSEISNNTADSAAAIANDGTLILDRSLVQKNKAVGEQLQSISGAVSANSLGENEYTKIINSTIALNDAPINQPAGVSVSDTGRLDLLNVTIVDNTGYGLEVKPRGTGTIKNTIIARQSEGQVSRPDCKAPLPGTFVSEGYNMISDTSCAFSGAGDIIVDNNSIGLLPLAMNGGATQTYALAETSPAVNSGMGCPASDQRGYGRPGGGSPLCDIGAYEFGGTNIFSYLPMVRR